MEEFYKRISWDTKNTPLIVDKVNDVFVNSEYLAFLKKHNGGRVADATVSFKMNEILISEQLDFFFSFNQLLANNHIKGYIEYLDSDAKEFVQHIIEGFVIFATTYEPNSFFAFSKHYIDNNMVYYINLDIYPFTLFKVCNSFNDFLNLINAPSNRSPRGE